jgi:HEAT repeat protein
MELDARAWQELIDRAALNSPEAAGRLVEAVKSLGSNSFPAIIRTFEGGSEVSTKRFLADLFLGPLRSFAKEAFLPALNRPDSGVFPWAAEILAGLKEPLAVPGLQQGLSATKPDAIVASLRGLAEFDDPAILKSLIDFMLSRTEWNYLAAAMRYLLPHGPRIAPQLRERFSGLPREKQAWIVKILAELGDGDSLPVFAEILNKQPLELGLFGVAGLGRIGTPAAVEVLQKTLASPEWFLRKRVVNALGNARCPEAIGPLIRALTDESVQVRMSAIESLSRVAPLDLEAVIAQLSGAGHELKIGLIRVLGQIRDPRVVAPLAKTLEDRTTLFFSIDALGDVGLPEATPAVERFLKDAEWFNRLNALEALGKIRPPHLRSIAEGSLNDPNDMVRNAATRILQATSG